MTSANLLSFYCRSGDLHSRDFAGEPPIGRLIRGQLRRTWGGRPRPEYALLGEPRVGAQVIRWDSPHTSRVSELFGAARHDSDSLHVIGRIIAKGPRGWRVIVTDTPGVLDEEARLLEKFRSQLSLWRPTTDEERQAAEDLRIQIFELRRVYQANAEQIWSEACEKAGVAAGAIAE